MLVIFGICFKQHFDTRYLVFYNPSSPRIFLSLDLLWEYRIQHGANGPLYVTSIYSTWIFCRGVSGFATDCPCGVWCHGLTTCLLHVGPPFGNWILNNSLDWIGLDLFNNDTRPSGYISRPTQVNVSQSCFHSLNNYSSPVTLYTSGG